MSPAPVAALVVALLGTAVAGCSPGAPAPTTGTPTVTSAAPSAAPSPTESLLADEVDEGTAVGEVAAGFPSDLVPVPPEAEVLVSSAQPLEDGRLRISLNVRTAQDAAGVLEAVRAPLVAAGFVETAPATPEAGLAAQSAFSRGDGAELLVVGVLDRDGTRTMTLGGTVAAPAP